MCNNIKLLDITLDVTQLAPGVNPNRNIRDLDAEDFCQGLKYITQSLTHLVLRKSNNVYLTLPKPKYVLAEIAKAMRNWDNLELADIAFRLSDDSGINQLTASLQHLSIHPPPTNLPEGPITSLTHALITRPKLRTFCTLLPSLWNETLLRVSTNPNLECIVLGDGVSRPKDYMHVRTTSLSGRNLDYDGASSGIIGTGLFLTQAKKHTRLSDLIRAGTSFIRTRAHTLGATPSPPSPSNPRSRSQASPQINYVRSQSVIPTSSGSSPSSNASTSSQKYRQQQQQQGDGQTRKHHPGQNTAKFDSARVSYGSESGTSRPFCR